MINIAVCDDERIFSDLVSKSIENAFCDKDVSAEIKGYVSSDFLIKDLNSKVYDLVFLDIDMPNFSGFDIAELIQNKTSETQIVFVSSKAELVYDSFEYRPFYFVRKSDVKNMNDTIKHVVEKYLSFKKQHSAFYINDLTYGKTVLCVKDILYIQSKGHYLYYYTAKREVPYHTRESLSEIEAKMVSFDFVRTHNRYLVNMNHIKNFVSCNSMIQISNDDTVSVSRAYKERAFQMYTEFRRR